MTTKRTRAINRIMHALLRGHSVRNFGGVLYDLDLMGRGDSIPLSGNIMDMYFITRANAAVQRIDSGGSPTWKLILSK